jgi:hypothetical protein
VTAERLSRFKIDHRMTGRPELSLLLELELFHPGIEGKHTLWRTLRSLPGNEPRLADFDFGDLVPLENTIRPVTCGFSTGQAVCMYSLRSVTGVTGKTSAQRLRDTSPDSAANLTRSTGSYPTRPTCRRSTAFSWRSTSSSAALARSPRHSTTTKPSIRQTSV